MKDVAFTREDLVALLEEAVARLTPQAHVDPRAARGLSVVARLRRVLDARPRVALGGEFSSGKSSLVNMLLAAETIPTTAVASALPAVRFVHGAAPALRIVRADGSIVQAPLGALASIDHREAASLEVSLPLPLLDRMDLVDTPGTSDPSRLSEQVFEIARHADIMVWCTNATQAWRESERRTWLALPERLRGVSVLAVTHVDLPRVQRGLDRLMRRMHEDAGDLFATIIPLSTLEAAAARDASGRVVDPALWAQSGGGALMDALDHAAEAVAARRHATAERLIARHLDPILNAFPAAPAGDAVPATVTKSAASEHGATPLAALWSHELDAIDADCAGGVGAEVVLRAASGAVGRFLDALRSTADDAGSVAEIARRFEDAAHFLARLSESDDPERVRLAAAALVQLEAELIEITRPVSP